MKINSPKLFLKSLLLLICMASSIDSIAALRAFLDYKVFYIPDNGPFLETIIEFESNSLSYVSINEQNEQVATVQVTLIIRQEEQVIDFRKNNISSQVKGADEAPSDFIDLQRFGIPNGNYTLELQLLDLNDPDAEVQILEQEIEIAIDENMPFISDITFIKAYSAADSVGELTKSGYDILPYVNSYFPSDVQRLAFYVEAYNADKLFGVGERYALTYFVTEEGKTDVVENLQRYERMEAKAASAMFQILDISQLKGGNYRLHVEMRDKENEAIANRSLSFFRNNVQASNQESKAPLELDIENTFVMQFTDAAELSEHIESAWPIMTNLERNAVQYYLETADLTTLRSFFYTLWERRNPDDPEAGWIEYAEQVKKVEAAYGTRIKRGYQSDRGRVYLQYGEPNTIVKRYNDTDAYPYEIWHFYKIGRFNNKRFVFYNPDLVTNDFALLNSDMPGEVREDQWVNLILQRNNALGSVERSTVDNGASRVLIDLWNNPR